MNNEKTPLTDVSGVFWLDLGEFVILEFQSVAHVDAEGKQSDGDFGDHAGVVVLDESVIAADINDSTEHIEPPHCQQALPAKIRPWFPRGESLYQIR